MSRYEREEIKGDVKINDGKTIRFRITRYPDQNEDHISLTTYVDSPQFRGYCKGITYPVSKHKEILETLSRIDTNKENRDEAENRV
jgi:hypothetical protein